MPTSGRLKKIGRAVRKLRAEFLPKKFSATGVYEDPKRVQSHTRAFLVLSHAELEEYFEEWAQDIAQNAEKVWDARRSLTEPLAFLVATLGEDVPIPDDIHPHNVRDKFNQVSKQCFNAYRHKINANHGIKGPKVVGLLGHVGVCAPFTVGLIAKLNVLAVKRGAHAHKSAKSVSVINVLDPKTEYDLVTGLLADLEAFDEWLVEYKKGIR